MFSKRAFPQLGALVLAACLSAVVAPAHAAIMLGGTRVIINEGSREASISMKNEANAPFVVQAWIDAGEGRNKTPFLVTPPLSRLDPGMENILRIVRTDDQLPSDRESVFWLNVKEIPERAEEENVLQVAVRSRIKVFYRPAALRGGDASQARSKLKWAVSTAAGGGAVLKIANPTPYNVTFTLLKVGEGKEEINPDMVPPLGELVVPLKSIRAAQALRLRFTTINDYGGETVEEAVNVPASEVPVAVLPQPVPVSPVP